MKRILPIILAAVCALCFTSCEKSPEKAIPGIYHFKISGNLECQCVTPGYEGIEANYIISSEAGQMYVIDNEDGTWVVNMSVMMSSYSLMFEASYDKKEDVLTLNRGAGILLLANEGSSGSLIKIAPAVKVDLCGSGTYYANGDYIIMKIIPMSNFMMDTDTDTGTVSLEYKVVDHSIVCFANKEK